MNHYKLKSYTVNVITLLRIIGIPIIFAIENQVLLIIFVNFLFLTDFFDGFLARKWGVASTTGAILDLLADKLLVIIVLFASVIKGDVFWLIFALIAAREIYSIILRVNHFRKEKQLIKASMAGKIKTTVQFIALNLTILTIPGYNIALIIVIILSYYSFIGYFKVSRGEKNG